jgi:transcriptional regulator with XRE-family HTH domain
VRLIRRVLDLSQADLAERMTNLGHSWVRQTVGEVERSGRVVSINELLGLAMALRASLVTLLDPSAIRGQDEPAPTDVGLAGPALMDQLWPLLVGAWVKRQPPYRESFGAVEWDENEPTRWVSPRDGTHLFDDFLGIAGESEDDRPDGKEDA